MHTNRQLRWLAICPRELTFLLAQELAEFGAEDIREQSAAVSFVGSTAVMYRANLWSRFANRVLLPMGSGPAGDADELYGTVKSLDWAKNLVSSTRIAVDFHGSNSGIRNTRFGAQRSKDAILDSCRESGLEGLSADPKNADLRVTVRLKAQQADVAIDLTGESLHRRGYRQGAGEAPIKENLAAAILGRAGWPALSDKDTALIDPMCGSGTLLIEGALMSADIAPALGRKHFSFRYWQGHHEEQWQALVADAKGRAERGLASEMPEIRGYDADPRVIRRAQENISAAGLAKFVRVSVKSLGEVKKPTHKPLGNGLVVCNPPYGERLGDKDNLPALYTALGSQISREFSGWQAGILAGSADLGRSLGLRSHRQYSFHNGPLAIQLILLDLDNNRFVDPRGSSAEGGQTKTSPDGAATESVDPWNRNASKSETLSAGAEMFANRLRKNRKRLKSWLRKSGNECFRLYDADMPEYSVAIDAYGDWLHVAEYAAPASVDPAAAERRLAEVKDALPAATGVPLERIVFKQRERQRGKEQYQPQAQKRHELSVTEGKARLLVNLHDYLDTGLFLDHRPLRLLIAEEAKSKRFLNLFAYTGSATVHAALGGASKTVSVDTSNRYLGWLGANLALNGVGEGRHERVKADVMGWLQDTDQEFDLVLLDPPSFSNSKSLDNDFDVQRDQVELVDLAMSRLAKDGVLYFSNNRRKFRLDPQVSERFQCSEITEETLDPDFSRRPPPHRCWKIMHKEC